MPGQKLTWIGLFSESPHNYPASNVNRTYSVTSDPKRGSRPGVDVGHRATKDGVTGRNRGNRLHAFRLASANWTCSNASTSRTARDAFRPASGTRRLYPAGR